MSKSDRDRWNSKYAQRTPDSDVHADDWLVEACGLIDQLSVQRKPVQRAVDLACGLGHNSIWLAQHGWLVDGVDISDKGLAHARKLADSVSCDVNFLQADIDDWTPSPGRYDLAIVFRFLDREAIPRIASSGLQSGGWIIYETFASGQLDRSDNHLGNRAYTLEPGELPRLFPEFDIIEFREQTLEDRTVQRMLARLR